jgi:hypothetical protein
MIGSSIAVTIRRSHGLMSRNVGSDVLTSARIGGRLREGGDATLWIR